MVSDFKKNKKKVGASILFKLGGVLVVIVAALLIIANGKIYQKKKELALEIKNLQSKVQTIKQQNNNLQQGIANANNDQYIEKVAREELGLQKEGEKVVSFVSVKSEASKNTASQKNTAQIWLDSISNSWQWLKSKF